MVYVAKTVFTATSSVLRATVTIFAYTFQWLMNGAAPHLQKKPSDGIELSRLLIRTMCY